MIDVKAAKARLIAELAARLESDGFRASAKEQAFRRAKPFGQWTVHIAFIPHRGVDLSISPSVSIRIDAVEDLANQHRNNLPAQVARRTATLGADLSNLSDTVPMRWTMVSLEDAAPVAEAICSDVRRIGYPFLERYSDMGNVFKLLSSSDSRDWWQAPGNDTRCNAAVTLAFLMGDPSTIESAVKACESQLAEHDPRSLPKFSEFVASLRAKQAGGELPKLQ